MGRLLSYPTVYQPLPRLRIHIDGSAIRRRITFANVVRLLLALMAVIAIPFDMHNRFLSPAPNWPLIVVEPIVLIAFLRCTVGSILQ
jgi:hypothetical protein